MRAEALRFVAAFHVGATPTWVAESVVYEGPCPSCRNEGLSKRFQVIRTEEQSVYRFDCEDNCWAHWILNAYRIPSMHYIVEAFRWYRFCWTTPPILFDSLLVENTREARQIRKMLKQYKVKSLERRYKKHLQNEEDFLNYIRPLVKQDVGGKRHETYCYLLDVATFARMDLESCRYNKLK